MRSWSHTRQPTRPRSDGVCCRLGPLLGAGVLLFRHRRSHYYRLRNVCLLTGLIGLAVFALFPVAPPRLTDLPVIDTVTRDAEGYRQLLPPSLVNEYAAMASFHEGWNLLVGIVAYGAWRQRLVRGFAILMPVGHDPRRGRDGEPLRDRRDGGRLHRARCARRGAPVRAS